MRSTKSEASMAHAPTTLASLDIVKEMKGPRSCRRQSTRSRFQTLHQFRRRRLQRVLYLNQQHPRHPRNSYLILAAPGLHGRLTSLSQTAQDFMASPSVQTVTSTSARIVLRGAGCKCVGLARASCSSKKAVVIRVAARTSQASVAPA